MCAWQKSAFKKEWQERRAHTYVTHLACYIKNCRFCAMWSLKDSQLKDSLLFFPWSFAFIFRITFVNSYEQQRRKALLLYTVICRTSYTHIAYMVLYLIGYGYGYGKNCNFYDQMNGKNYIPNILWKGHNQLMFLFCEYMFIVNQHAGLLFFIGIVVGITCFYFVSLHFRPIQVHCFAYTFCLWSTYVK